VRAQERVVRVDEARAARDLSRTERLHQSGAVTDAALDSDMLRVKNLSAQDKPGAGLRAGAPVLAVVDLSTVQMIFFVPMPSSGGSRWARQPSPA
jgi:hypothetical protein